MKKHLSIILVLAALLIPCLTPASADLWDVRLPAELTEIEAAAFQGDTSLDSVYVDDNVTSIGSRAFADSSLRDIRLPEALTELAADTFLNVPHVEVYGFWNADLLDGMDNVSKSGAELPADENTIVPVAAGQEVFRTIPISMTGTWYIGVENCSSAELYTTEGEKIDDLTFGTFAYFVNRTFTEMEDVILCIRNDTDTLIEAKVYIESPFRVNGYIGTLQAEYKGDPSLTALYYTDSTALLLEELDAHQYFAPVVRTTFSGDTENYSIDLYVDELPIARWEGTLESTDKIQDFVLQPADVMKFGGFDAGKHSFRIVANGAVSEYTYELTGARKPQSIGQEASSLYLLPDQHVFATFTAESDGVYSFRSDSPAALQLYGRLLDEEGNILDSKDEETESYNFNLSAPLTKGQTVCLEAWFASQADSAKPFYGVVTLIVNDPSTEGVDIFRNATCRALVIGETYKTAPEAITRLDGCRKDADCMATMLANLAGSPYSVTEKIDPTAAGILAAIPEAFANATENDVSLFYYSGHGQSGSGALIGNDAEAVTPEALKAALDNVPGTKIVLLDSCFSGYLIGRGTEEDAGAKAALDHFMSVFSWASRGEGSEYYVLTASSQYQTSIGYRGACSLFTGNLLDGMGYDPNNNSAWTGICPADTNHDGMFTLDELFVYCRNEIRGIKLGQTVCPFPYNCSQVIFIDEIPEQ